MKMNYSKTVREYCKTTPLKIFDVSYEMKHHFEMVPYKTLLKILNRLEEEGKLETISKGVYLIKSGESVDDPILEHYASGNRGLVVGYDMYNRYGITGHQEKPTVIYTNAMETETKNIGNEYLLIRFPMVNLDKRPCKVIELLELIEKGPKIIDEDFKVRSEVIIKLAINYDDYYLRVILKAHRYQYSTICALDSVLKELHIKNDAINVYKKECLDA